MDGLFSFRLRQALGGGIFAFLPIFAAMAGLSTSLIGVILTVNYLSPSLLTPVAAYWLIDSIGEPSPSLATPWLA